MFSLLVDWIERTHMEAMIAEAEVDALDLWANYLWMIYCWWCLNIWLDGSDMIEFMKEAQFMGPLRFPVESIQPLLWFNSKQHFFLFFRSRITTWRRRHSFALKSQIHLHGTPLQLRCPMVTSQHYNLPEIKTIWETWNHLSHTSILSWIIWGAVFFFWTAFKTDNLR